MTGQPRRALPPGLDLLWGRREPGRRGPKPGLSVDGIVAAAVRLADAEGLEAVSMARVAKELGFTTMSLYRYVTSKDELLQLMWNASAQGAENLDLEGTTWRERFRSGRWCSGTHTSNILGSPRCQWPRRRSARIRCLRRARIGNSRRHGDRRGRQAAHHRRHQLLHLQ